MRAKLSLFCNVPAKYIIQNLDAESLYQVPLMLEREKFADKVCEALQLPLREPELQDWEEMVDRFQHTEREVTIASVGKHIHLHDADPFVVDTFASEIEVLGTTFNVYADEENGRFTTTLAEGRIRAKNLVGNRHAQVVLNPHELVRLINGHLVPSPLADLYAVCCTPGYINHPHPHL